MKAETVRQLPVFLFATCLLLFLAGCARRAVLYNPPPVAFTPLHPRQVETAIIAGMSRRGWVPTREGPGVIVGTLHLRSHTAIVRIHYSDKDYTLQYVSSENLNFSRASDGTEQIHPNYNSWVKNLIGDIDSELASAAANVR